MDAKVMKDIVENLNSLSVEYQTVYVYNKTSATFIFSKVPKMVGISLSYYVNASNNYNYSTFCEVANRAHIYLTGVSNGSPLSITMTVNSNGFTIGGWGIAMGNAYCIAFI